MTTDEADARGRAGCAKEALRTLAAAVDGASLPAGEQATASLDPRAPQDGLALLGAYVTIEDRSLRQALLDLVVAISRAKPR